MAQEIIINASATAAKEVIFATFDTSGSAIAPTSLSVGDILWRPADGTFVTAAGAVSLIGSNVYRYLPTQAEVSVPGKAVLTVSKTSVARVYEMIDIRGPQIPSAPIYTDTIISATTTRIPFRVFDSFTRLPAAGLTFTSAEVFISYGMTTYVTAGGSVTAIGNGDYAYIVTAPDVSAANQNLLQIRKAGYYSDGAVYTVYNSVGSSAGLLQVAVVSMAPSVISAQVLTSTVYEAMADNVVSRRIKAGASGTRTVGEALAMLRNRVVRTETGYSVYDVDDTSVLYSGSVTTSLSSSPITEMNPV